MVLMKVLKRQKAVLVSGNACVFTQLNEEIRFDTYSLKNVYLFFQNCKQNSKKFRIGKQCLSSYITDST